VKNIDKQSKNNGISLIEVLVAFVILSISVTVLFRIFSSGATNTVIAQQYINAVQIAESHIAKAGVSSEFMTTVDSGITDDKFTWQTTIEPYQFHEEPDMEFYPVSAYRVTVQVSWQERGQVRNIVLSTIKLSDNDVLNET
jgi:general secretion pathway protein I